MPSLAACLIQGLKHPAAPALRDLLEQLQALQGASSQYGWKRRHSKTCAAPQTTSANVPVQERQLCHALHAPPRPQPCVLSKPRPAAATHAQSLALCQPSLEILSSIKCMMLEHPLRWSQPQQRLCQSACPRQQQQQQHNPQLRCRRMKRTCRWLVLLRGLRQQQCVEVHTQHLAL